MESEITRPEAKQVYTLCYKYVVQKTTNAVRAWYVVWSRRRRAHTNAVTANAARIAGTKTWRPSVRPQRRAFATTQRRQLAYN
jgi:hypothetical protein